MPSHSDLQSAPEPEPEPAICGWLTLDIIEDAGDWSKLNGARAAIEAAVRALAAHKQFKSHSPAQICIALSDDAHVRRLNATYRGKDKPTNVLSFPAGGDAQELDAQAVFLGDVVLALETIAAEAADLGLTPLHHLQHLAIHGVLHLNGYDHETDEDAAIMEGLEIEILAGLGIPSPYAQGLALEPAAGE